MIFFIFQDNISTGFQSWSIFDFIIVSTENASLRKYMHEVADLWNSEILEIVGSSVLISRQNSFKLLKMKSQQLKQQFLKLNNVTVESKYMLIWYLHAEE